MTKNVYDVFKTIDDLETKKGIVLDFGEFSFTILRAGLKNKKFTQALTKHSRKHQKKIQKGLLTKEQDREILVNVYADAIVVDWKGIKDDSGKNLPFNRENCVKLLEDLPDLFEMIHEEANNMTNFQKETEEIKKS